MQVLADASGRVIEREEIYQQVWGYAMAHGDRSVDVFVRKLRAKLEKLSPDWGYIHTHFGVGYRFDPMPTAGLVAETVPEPTPARAPDGFVGETVNFRRSPNSANRRTLASSGVLGRVYIFLTSPGVGSRHASAATHLEGDKLK